MSVTQLNELYAIAPTPTTIGPIDVRDCRLGSLSIENVDGTGQTLDGTIRTAVYPGGSAGASSLADLTAIAQGASNTRRLDVDCAACSDLYIDLTASGLGCNARVSWRPDQGRR